MSDELSEDELITVAIVMPPRDFSKRVVSARVKVVRLRRFAYTALSIAFGVAATSMFFLWPRALTPPPASQPTIVVVPAPPIVVPPVVPRAPVPVPKVSKQVNVEPAPASRPTDQGADRSCASVVIVANPSAPVFREGVKHGSRGPVEVPLGEEEVPVRVGDEGSPFIVTLVYRDGAEVMIDAAPWAIVKRDGIALGRTPRPWSDAEGVYRYDFFAPAGPPMTITAKVNREGPCKAQKVDADRPRGSLCVATPGSPDTNIFVDGNDTKRIVPVTPGDPITLTAGSHRVTLVFKNGERRSVDVEIEAGAVYKLIEK